MQTLDANSCRKARLSRDPRFDGQFFLAVTSTGIYCRPICPARPPRESNVRYYRTAAEAAQSGFRPCLRCRPESAPNSPAWKGTSTTVNRALQLINAGELNGQSLPEFSARLGVGERYLRKLFEAQLGVSPSAMAQTQRLHFAQKLLLETNLPVAEIAYASGFGSLRRFNSATQAAFGCNPRDMRRSSSRAVTATSAITLELSYRPPYDWPGMLSFYRRHSVAGIERVTETAYYRNLLAGETIATMQVSKHPTKHALLLSLQVSDTSLLMPIVAQARRMFDLDANPHEISATLQQSSLLAPLIEACPGVRSPVYGSSFEACCRAVVGQQVSTAAARSVCNKLAEACAKPRGNAQAGLLTFPAPRQILALPDTALPMPRTRKSTLRAVCEYFAQQHALSQADPREDLIKLKGIGPWTIAMLGMRGLGDPDSFPAGDLGLVKAAQARGIVDAKALQQQLALCKPWRSYAANLLWRSLDS